MSIVKYRLKEVATDFGMKPKDIAEIMAKFFEPAKSNTQVLTEEELNVIFDYLTQNNQISSLEAVFAVQPKPKAEEPKVEAPKAEEKKPAAPAEKKPGNAEAPKPQPKAEKPQKPAEPERKRERRVVDMSAVQVNVSRFDDHADDLVSERVQNYQGGKQRFAKKGQQQNNKKDNKFAKGNKSKNEEQEKLRKLQMEVARKAPVTVKIPDEITVGELASRMKKTAGEVIKLLMKNGVMAGLNQTIDFDTAEFVAVEMGCKV